MTTDIIYNVILLGITIGYGLVFLKKPKLPKVWLTAFVYSIIACALAYVMSVNSFHFFRLACWWLFIYCPIILLWCYYTTKKRNKFLAYTSLLKFFLVVSVGIDAFFIEPNWLQVTEYNIESSKITKPIKIAVVADLQTDDVGEYEKKALLTAQAQNPDLILFCGDYIQADEEERQIQYQKLNDLLLEIKLRPNLGAFAVGGDFDPPGWTKAFNRTKIECLENTATRQAGEIYVTGLNLFNSFNSNYRIGKRDNFHIVFGHGPDFSLGENDADLLIAGHTHGGQVQIPFYGPPITLSKIPREWADTKTEITPNQNLVVSKGVGMERGYAPEMRFLCRPEIVVINLVPA